MWLRFALGLLLALPGWGQQYRAFWVDAFNRGFKNPAEIEELIENAVTAKANAIFMQARRRGDVYYLRSQEPPAQDGTWNPNFDALDYLIDRAHARGLEVHAWFVMTRLWTSPAAPVDPRHLWNRHGPTAEGEAFWLTRTATGQNGNSLDPGHPAAFRHMADVVVDAVGNYSIDGVHLDYIRYPEDADYGWNPTAVERFNRLESRSGSPARTDAAWADFRRRQVTQLVRQIYLRSVAVRPSIKVSAAVITWGSGPSGEDLDASYRRLDAYARVFQDWRGWLEEGILDFAMPMHYFNDVRNGAFLDRWLTFARERQFRRAVVTGLGNYLNPIESTVQQLQRVFRPSLESGRVPLGVSFYSYANTNENNAQRHADFYRTVGDFFGEWVTVPDLPWKSRPAAGHAYGRIEVDGGPAWRADGLTVRLESDTDPGQVRRLVTDATGFFGAVDLPPDRYRVSLEWNGQVLLHSVAREIGPGDVVEFPVYVKEADFAPASAGEATSSQP
jgi:uncharacterized lipoprotein YddW (UPF0748 family)